MKDEHPEQEHRGKAPRTILSYDWYSSGFYPWRLAFFMAAIMILVVLVCSHINVEFSPPAHRNKYPESVFFINEGQMFSLTVDQSMLPLSRTGPVWADPVSSGMEGELFFPLGAGLSEKSGMKTLETDPYVDRSDFFINYLALAPVQVDKLVIPEEESGPSVYRPAVDVWSDDMDYSYIEGEWPVTDVDLRGVSSSFWVRVNERGAPVSILLMESSKDDMADQKALEVVRKLRWLPGAAPRQGMVSIDWQTAEGLDK